MHIFIYRTLSTKASTSTSFDDLKFHPPSLPFLLLREWHKHRAPSSAPSSNSCRFENSTSLYAYSKYGIETLSRKRSMFTLLPRLAHGSLSAADHPIFVRIYEQPSQGRADYRNTRTIVRGADGPREDLKICFNIVLLIIIYIKIKFIFLNYQL